MDEKWYGFAGHFCGGHECAYHLCTRIQGYLISTVGAYKPGKDGMIPIGASPNAFYETYVFKCEGEDKFGNPVIDLSEIDGERYADSMQAEKGHYRYLNKYRNLGEPNE